MKLKKGVSILGISLVFAILGISAYVFFTLTGYAILFLTVAVVLFIMGINQINKNSSPARIYESTVRDILNTFDSILVKSNTVPNLEGRNIIQVMSIDDLVDAQLEIRKPICYLKQTESCSFVLLDEKEAYIYVEKLNDEVTSPVEIAMKEEKIKAKNKEEMDSEMLREIEKTTVVKLSNKKSYKVSPIRKKEKDEKNKENSDEKNIENNEDKKEEIIEEFTEVKSIEEPVKEKVEFLDEMDEKEKKKKIVVEELDFEEDKKRTTNEVLDEIEFL